MALVTGGTRGIGLAIVRALRRKGARVVAITKSKDQIAFFEKEFGEDPLATAALADVRDRAALVAVRQGLSQLDILIPTAGLITRVTALYRVDDALRDLLETYLYGVFVKSRASRPFLSDM